MKRTIRITSMLLAIVMAVSFSACNDQTAVSRTDSNATDTTISSNIDSAEVSSDTETSKEETSSDTSSSKSETSSDTNSSESSATTTAVTTTTNKTTTTNSTSSPKEEKTEEREVYDEDGNVVDKIKVKVVDGVAYTVGEKSDDKCILDGVPLYTNDPEFPSGDIITMTQIAICRRGFNISQQEIFEKYVKYHTPDEWYEEDGVSYGPMLGGEYLNYDPRLEPQKFSNGFFVNLNDYCGKFFEDKNVEFYDNFPFIHGGTELERIKKAIFEGYLVAVEISDPAYGYEELEWFVMKDGGSFTTQGLHSNYRNAISIGFADTHCIVYNTSDGKISVLSKKIFDAYTI